MLNTIILTLHFCFQKCFVWNTFGPIERSIRYAYPNWNADTVAMMANWGTISFLLAVGPICWILHTTNLRFASILSCSLMTIGTLFRVITWSDPLIFLVFAHICSFLNGITSVIVMAAPPALTATWFPLHERGIAISISQTVYAAGTGVSFLLGPKMVPDYFLNKTGETDHSRVVPLVNLNETYPTRDEEKYLIWCYMLVMALFSCFILLAMIIYFPPSPISQLSISKSINQTNIGFIESIMSLLKNRNTILCLIGFSFSTGVQQAWASVMTVNFAALEVDDKTTGYIGVSAIAANIVIGILFGKLIDYQRKLIKWTLIGVLFVSTVAYVCLTLLVLKIVPYSLPQLYVATICGSGFVTAITILFFEYTVEMSYPISEGIVGGLLTTGNNMVRLFSLWVIDLN